MEIEDSTKYDYVYQSLNGISIVVKDGLYGAVLLGGKEIIPPKYHFISPFKNGIAYAIKEDEIVNINLSGIEYVNKIIPFNNYGVENGDLKKRTSFFTSWKDRTRIKEDKDLREINSKSAYWDDIEEEKEYVKFDSLTCEMRLPNGFYLVKKDERYGCINQKGKIIIPFSFDYIDCFGNLMIAERRDNENLTQTVIDLYNNVIIKFKEDEIVENIADDLILFRKKDTYLYGAYNDRGSLLCDPIYENITKVNENLILVEKSHERRGLMNIKGEDIIPLTEGFNINSKRDNGLIEIKDWDRFGLIDSLGNIVLPPIYHHIGDYNDGFAIVTKADRETTEWGTDQYKNFRYGVIDDRQNLIIRCVFSKMEYDSVNRIFKTEKGCKTIEGGFIAINNGETILLPQEFDYCENFIDGVAILLRGEDIDKKYGLINDKKVLILPTIFEDIKYLGKGKYGYEIGYKWGIVDKDGYFYSKNIYDGVIGLIENLILVYKSEIIQMPLPLTNRENKYYGFVNLEGEEVIHPIYEYVGKCVNGYMTIMRGGIWYIFNIQNPKELIEIPNANFIGYFNSNLFRINIGGKYQNQYEDIKGGKWGYIDRFGNLAIGTNFDNAQDFSEGLAAVQKGGKWGFINNKNDVVVPFEYEDFEESFKEGKGKLIKNEEIYVFNRNGEILETYPEEDYGYDDGPYDDEPYDYERDTYYALGGDDYEAWKERGGDLDRMMEGMGL